MSAYQLAVFCFFSGVIIHAVYKFLQEAYYIREADKIHAAESSVGYDPLDFGFVGVGLDEETGERVHYHTERGKIPESQLNSTDRIVLNLSALNPYNGNIEPLEQ